MQEQKNQNNFLSQSPQGPQRKKGLRSQVSGFRFLVVERGTLVGFEGYFLSAFPIRAFAMASHTDVCGTSGTLILTVHNIFRWRWTHFR
jgi:hypothetical protein